ncbi:SusD/RagB family nutrient-binding outer membrane lipoprotein [Chitinophaga silvatica]|uniref:SusD/RagB family nutrient-binding outer membrane lipoprotein n=1 Tax=Chitinophaga silvatica TaxID=2282649 RepID=A0A3E1Y3U1_9BACT|nr:SusD/RagB family nutrient-binding outer membrane lipoprotein [Chitinophaga silvatica]RFS19302.1 SusD/RagB family nutrient-binding outer membrane lipoprotein [Chitinophaga silvatica]
MKSLFYSVYTIGLAGLLSLAACSKFVDINTDPNNPVTAQLPLLLPSTQVSLAANMYQLNSGTATFMQYTVFSSGLSRLQQQGTSFDDSWNGFYTQTLNDLEAVILAGTAQEQWGYTAVAKLEKAYLISIMVDMWGDIPYSETQQGQKNVSPKFEKGEGIYESVFTTIESGIADINKVTATTLVPATSDLIYSGNKSAWLGMANSLKLKLFNQVRLVNPARSADTIKSLIKNAGQLIGGTTNSNSLDFTFRFGPGQNPNNRHPWHRAEYQGSKTFYQSQSFIDLLFNNDDPRLRYFIFRQNATAGLNNSNNSNGYYGRNPGDGTAAPADLNRRSTFGIYPAGGLYDNAPINNIPATNLFLTNTGATGSLKVVGPTDGNGAGLMPFITNAMVKFIRAEAVLTLNTGEDARQLLKEGIIANLTSVSTYAQGNGGQALATAAISTFAEGIALKFDAATVNGKLDILITQKYIAQFGNGMEAYTDYRRTGLPTLRPPLSPLNVFPLRLYYSETELIANTSLGNNAASMQVAQQTTPVFWDK